MARTGLINGKTDGRGFRASSSLRLVAGLDFRRLAVSALVVAITLGVLAVAGVILQHRRREAREKALQRLRYLYLTGMASIAWLFDVMREDPSNAGLERAQGIVLTWVGNVIDALGKWRASHKNFAFGNFGLRCSHTAV